MTFKGVHSKVLASDSDSSHVSVDILYSGSFQKSVRKRHTSRLALMSDNAFKLMSHWIKQRVKMMVKLYMRVFRTVGLAGHALQRIWLMSFTLGGRHRLVHTWIVHSVHTNFRSELNIPHILSPYLFSIIIHKPYLNSLPEG